MSNYILQAHRPYEAPDDLFCGSEEELADYMRRHRSVSSYPISGGRFIKSVCIAGYLRDDLTIFIEGPDVTQFMGEHGISTNPKDQ